MTQNHILIKHIQKVHEWLKEINQWAGWDDQHKSLAVLRATLHQLRDNMPVENIAHLSAQLPLVIRGLLFENWRPSDTPRKDRKADIFLSAIEDELYLYPDIDVEKGSKAVFKTLSSRISEDEIKKIRKVLAKEIRKLWEDSGL